MVPGVRLKELSDDPGFRGLTDDMVRAYREYAEETAWFRQAYPGSALDVAYFSMEFGLSEALPIYSGGLGILAGDYLKTASDLGVPVIGVGLLYQQGYFRQSLDVSGFPDGFYPYNDPSQLPVLRSVTERRLAPDTVDFPAVPLAARVGSPRGKGKALPPRQQRPVNSPADPRYHQ